jgi:hypothetical protein
VKVKTNINPYSACAVPVDIYYNNDRVGKATAFFVENNGRLFLISNWHVFSGRDPKTGQPKDQTNYTVPTHLKIKYHRSPDFGIIEHKIALNSTDGSPKWIQSKKYGQRVDVAAIEVLFHRTYWPYTVTGSPQARDMMISVGSDIFVLGFPLGVMTTGLFPVWKRGSVATEFEIDANNLPSFIIDTATREGMSGSPVIARANGSYLSANGNSIHVVGLAYRFLGIYSGRYVGGIDEAHLGIVWKEATIDDILREPVPGTFDTEQ